MKHTIKLLAAAGLLALAPLSQAAITPAKQELINKLLAIQQPGLEILARDLVQRPMVPLMQSASQALQQVPADKREAVAKTMEADVKKFADEAIPMVKASAIKNAPGVLGSLLDERFTEDELRTIVAWMESPVSKKFGAVQPDLQKALVEKIMAENGAQLDARFKSLQQSMANTLGIKPAPAPASAAPAPKAAVSKAAPVKK